MSLYNRILGIPFIYNRVRPAVVGGIDMSPVYKRLQAAEADTILDVGCGTGDALNYLKSFERYYGVDIDQIAIGFAQQHYAGRKGVSFECKMLDEKDVAALSPTRVVLAGLLHHLTDEEVVGLLRMVASSSRFRRIVTQDIVYLPDARLSNFFARLDRGRYCRVPKAYEQLVEKAGLRLVESAIIRSHPTRGRVRYFVMSIEA